MRRILKNRQVVSWALYDWANSAYSTTVMAGFFPVFYSVLSQDLTKEDAQFWFNICLACASIVVAISAPVLGAIADRGGARKKFLATFAMLGILMSAGLAWVHSGMWAVGLLIYALGQIGFAGANIFYDSMLVDVADEDDFDVVSGFGYALGYIGGGLLFLVNVLMVTKPAAFGLAGAESALSLSFLSVGVWWLLFTIPLLLLVEETPPRRDLNATRSIRAGLRQLASTFGQVRQLRVVFIFLIGYWLYIDGVGTIIKMAVFFASRILELPRDALITALLLTQFVAFPAALAFGWVGKRIGPRNGILIGLAVYVLVVLYAWRWLENSADFYKLAVAIGLVQGGVQSLSRSLYARIIPRGKSAEFFGFFNMVGKFASIFGPLLIAVVPVIFSAATERDAILVLLLLFGGGALFLFRVDTDAGVAAARALEKPGQTSQNSV